MNFLFLIVFTSLFSQDLPLEDYKGKVLYIDFWASWCAPCALSFPWMKKIKTKYKDKNFALITVNLDEDKKDADMFIKKHKASKFKVIYDAKSIIADKYNIVSLPSSLIFDKKGKLIVRHSGFTSKKAKIYEDELDKLINQP